MATERSVIVSIACIYLDLVFACRKCLSEFLTSSATNGMISPFGVLLELLYRCLKLLE